MKKKVIIGIIFLFFIIWSILVANNSLSLFDDAIYNFVIGFKSYGLTKFLMVITQAASTKFIVSMIVISFLFLLKKKKWPIYLAICMILSTSVNLITKSIIGRERPDHFKYVIEDTLSYPSGHAMGSATFYGFLLFLLIKSNFSKKYKIIFGSLLCLLVLIIGISRVYLGVHYPSDIIGGWCLSIIIILLLDCVYEKGCFKWKMVK